MTFSDVCAMMYEFHMRTGHQPRTLHLTYHEKMTLLYDLYENELEHHHIFDGQGEEILGLELVISDTTGVT